MLESVVNEEDFDDVSEEDISDVEIDYSSCSEAECTENSDCSGTYVHVFVDIKAQGILIHNYMREKISTLLLKERQFLV